MKYVIWGLGAVGLSFLNKVIDNEMFNPHLFYCVDANEKTKNDYLNLGGLVDHFILDEISKDNIDNYLKELEEGDYLLDFAININNIYVLKYCLKHKIHYLNTADSSWRGDYSWISNHQHFLEYSKIRDKARKNTPTSIYMFGMNPGMVSCFTKKCLKEIVDNDDSPYIRSHRQYLKSLIEKNKYALLCKKINVTQIQEIDNDNQITNIKPIKNTYYSTWNPHGFFFETMSSPEIAFGTKEEFLMYDKIYDLDIDDLYLGLYYPSFMYKEKTYSPQGDVVGNITTHEEIFTIRKYLTYKDYRPTIYFVYSPCELASQSIELNIENGIDKFSLINKSNIIKGGESVGIIIQGEKFKTRYFGNYIDNKDTEEVPTIIQVSASAFAAFKYMHNHPNEGMLLPENLDEEEILDTAKVYLKEYINIELQKIEMNIGKKN